MEAIEASKKTILCFGDCNTWGAVPGLKKKRFPQYVRWPGVLFKLLRTRFRVVEEGLYARTAILDDPIESAFGIERNGARILGAALASHAPVDLVIIMLGTNDLKRRFAMTAADIAAGVGVLAQRARAPEFGPEFMAPPEVLVICPPAIWEVEANSSLTFKGGREKSMEFPTVFNRMGKDLGVPILFAEDFIHSDPADGIHLSAKSHETLGQELARWVLERYGNS
ncbi:MAG: SGNH/GDSL hydrolase family protein [Planctomycetota bacterium]|jgi:lysophospholipase L1-like esterase|nr:SGNH/GDSL hydrolase family protein [Planctomycetota bacterium]